MKPAGKVSNWCLHFPLHLCGSCCPVSGVQSLVTVTEYLAWGQPYKRRQWYRDLCSPLIANLERGEIDRFMLYVKRMRLGEQLPQGPSGWQAGPQGSLGERDLPMGFDVLVGVGFALNEALLGPSQASGLLSLLSHANPMPSPCRHQARQRVHHSYRHCEAWRPRPGSLLQLGDHCSPLAR